jgi:hypothetical protein
MGDHEDAIARQSDRPLEPNENKVVRYVTMELFWAGQRTKRQLKALAAYIAAAVGFVGAAAKIPWDAAVKYFIGH